MRRRRRKKPRTQRDSNPRPPDYEVSVLPLCHIRDPKKMKDETIRNWIPGDSEIFLSWLWIEEKKVLSRDLNNSFGMSSKKKKVLKSKKWNGVWLRRGGSLTFGWIAETRMTASQWHLNVNGVPSPLRWQHCDLYYKIYDVIFTHSNRSKEASVESIHRYLISSVQHRCRKFYNTSHWSQKQPVVF